MNLDLKYLELEAAHVCDDEGTAPALASIAISLKRIADVLDGSAVGLNVNETMFGQPYGTR